MSSTRVGTEEDIGESKGAHGSEFLMGLPPDEKIASSSSSGT